MSELVDHELDRLRRERDALDDANTKLGDQLIDARTERDEAQAEAERLRERSSCCHAHPGNGRLAVRERDA